MSDDHSFAQENVERGEARVSSHHIIVFTKLPKPGYAKTRLIPSVGKLRAAQISAALTARTLRTVRSLYDGSRYHTLIHYAAPTDVHPHTARDWLTPTLRETLLAQCPGDLGQRLIHAFEYSFSSGATHAVVIGTDAPDLNSSDIRDAFSALDHTDIVLGPAADGGYYLLGLRSPAPSLFTNIPWSTSTVARATCAAASTASLTLTQLRELRDVDEGADLVHHEWLSAIGSGNSTTPEAFAAASAVAAINTPTDSVTDDA